MAVAIKAENISKAYQLGEFSTGTLSRDIERAWYKLRGKEDPFLKIGETNDRTSSGQSDVVWSLKDINFDIEQGQAIGIIGRNGAGKSTLLKVLSRVTTPTVGTVKLKGRIASLLEVGTGFHPELTGRENIFLNGAILGMRKYETKRKFDEIVNFAGVERYIDTPVKRYSSGMYVRLAFAVAAHLDSEILIVDEVLAVGDAEFQKKCLGKMGDVSQGQGRTVLFVSHNMAAISSLCTKAMILKNGTLYKYGTTSHMINEYMQLGGDATSGESVDDTPPGPHQKLKIRRVRVLNNKEEATSEIINNVPGFLEVTVEIVTEGRGYDISIELINAEYGTIFCSTLKDTDTTAHDSKILKKGLHCYRIALPVEYLRGGSYTVITRSAIPKVEMLDVFKYDIQFTLVDITSPVANTTEGRPGAILPILTWREHSI